MSQNIISISKQVIIYLKRKPYIQETLEQDLINYSALARKLAKELNDVNVEAVKSTLIRYARKLRANKQEKESKIVALLNKASFSIENKIATIHHISPIEIESIAYSKTPSGYMYFVKGITALNNKSKYKKIDYGYVIIHITSPKEIEETPGVAAFLLSALASEDINIVHLMDCREDTFLVVKEYDAPLTFKILAEKLRI